MNSHKLVQTAVTILMVTGLSACKTAKVEQPIYDAKRLALVNQECAMYFAVNRQMLARGLAEFKSLTSGCKSSELVVDVSPMNPPPQITSRFGAVVYQRMLARGMSEEIAREVRNSRAFLDVIEGNDAYYGS